MTSPASADAVQQALTRLARNDSGRILSLLASRFGDLDLADEAVQEALVQAADQWPVDGVPANPAGWLHTVAKRRAIDRLRRTAAQQRRFERAQADLVERRERSDAGGLHMIDTNDDPAGGDELDADERLRLMLLCCHPAISPDAQVALTLRLVGGLTTSEIAAASLVPEATLAQRIVRAKQKIKVAGIPMSVPADIDGRMATVCAVLYLIFNEGYWSSSPDADAVRLDLAAEAIRLTRLVSMLCDASSTASPTMVAEVDGLLALELFQSARLGTRLDGRGDLVLLEDQDRTRWDREAISEGNARLADAMARRAPGPYQLQAAIAAHHAAAPSAEDTDWATIAALYHQLVALAPSAITELNRAVAVGMHEGPEAGLALVDRIEGLDDYHLLHATRAELLVRAGRPFDAVTSFEQAFTLARRPAERRHLQRRLAALS